MKPDIGTGMGLWGPALMALRAIGVEQVLRKKGGKEMDAAGYRDERGRWLVRPSPLSQTRLTRCLALHRSHLIRTLKDAANSSARSTGAGCDVVLRNHAEVVSYEEKPTHVEVMLSNGEKVMASYLIGADGLRSRVRHTMHASSSPSKAQPTYAGYTYYRAVLKGVPDIARGPAYECWSPER